MDFWKYNLMVLWISSALWKKFLDKDISKLHLLQNFFTSFPTWIYLQKICENHEKVSLGWCKQFKYLYHLLFFTVGFLPEGFTIAILSKTPKSKWSFLKLLSIKTIVIKSFRNPFCEHPFQFSSSLHAFCYHTPLLLTT